MKLSYSFKGLAHCSHGGEPGGMKADTVIEVYTPSTEGSRYKNRQNHRP